MTEKKLLTPPSGFFLNAERRGRGMRISVGAVIAVAEFSKERILLVSHGGRIEIGGAELSLSVFQGRGIEILGGVKEIRFLYAKN